MAGSYSHATTADGRLRSNESFVEMVENLGDAYETVEEMYGMIWWMAAQLALEPMTRLVVEQARANWKNGLNASPGVEGKEQP